MYMYVMHDDSSQGLTFCVCRRSWCSFQADLKENHPQKKSRWAKHVLPPASYFGNRVLFPYMQGDEAELAKKIATLQWHEKEMEVRPLVCAIISVCIEQ